MKRRKLLERLFPWLSMGSGLWMLLELLPAPVRPGGSLRLELASLQEVRTKGYLLYPATPMGPVALVWDQGQHQVVALNPRCPHRGCLVRRAKQDRLLVCPCHQALFGQEGQWVGGQRRTRSLQRYGVAIQNGRVSVVG